MKRTCKKCGETKEIEAFVSSKMCNFGRTFECRECHKEYARKWREINGDRIREESRIFLSDPENRRKKRLYDIDAKKLYRKRHPQLRYGRINFTEKHVKQYKVNVKVHEALKRGELERKPCEVCAKIEKVHAHHDDYSKPLEVRWLCPLHHKAEHMKIKTQVK